MSVTGAKPLLTAATATGSSDYFNVNTGALVNIQAFLSNTTTPAATVIIEGTNEDTPANPATIYTFALSGAAAVLSRTFISGFYWIRVRCSAITGTNATVTALGRVVEL